jgi:hypothetical protein
LIVHDNNPATAACENGTLLSVVFLEGLNHLAARHFSGTMGDPTRGFPGTFWSKWG